ncbi:MAG: lipopolysaccharide heptosyltransferase II [Pseudomonadota bacterium]|nr:lipopolysaccharide heptosyltransferase II [Pseudomonadota bacterium]
MVRTLIIAPQWIGDAVMSEPLLARLAARGEHLSVGALPWVAPVYRAMPQVAQVVELPFAHGRLDWTARRRLAAGWRGRFDRAYVLPHSLKSALLPWLAGIPLRIGYRGEHRWGLLNRRLPNPGARPPMVAFYSALAGPSASEGARPVLSFGPDLLGTALAAAGVESGRFWVFAPGAEFGPSKRWPPARYAELARVLHDRTGLPVLLLGSAQEAALCEQIAAQAGGACRVLAGRTALTEAMALIAQARGMVSNDSGLMHVAAAFGVPQAAVFGSTSPQHTPPLNPRARVVWMKAELGLDCAPCFERTCRYGHYRCLTGVPVARVDAALAAGLEEGGAEPVPPPQSTNLPT